MESLERKDVPAMLEEPIKTENIIPNSSTSDKRKGAVSPPPHCSICLGQLVNPSFTDSCLHQFCFCCLVEWSKIKTECPLCKQIFKSIIHNVRSERDYDLHHVPAQVTATLDVTADIHISGISGPWDISGQPFMYRTTMGHHRRSFGMIVNASAVARREQIPSIAHQIPSDERRRRTSDPIDYRRTVYRQGVWAIALPDAFGRFRQSSAAYYRTAPTEVNRLVPWLNRELQVLLNNNGAHIAYVLTVITENLTQYDIRSPEFKNLVRPYFGIHTDHFVHEFSTFARSNFDLHGYDQAVTYIANRGLTNQYVPRAISPALSSSSSSSSDSDVRVLTDDLDLTRLLQPVPTQSTMHFRPIDMPGPSTVSQMLRVSMPYTTPDVLTISSSSSSENECEVVGYVKPRHERTPEIILLSSSETEELNAAAQPVLVDNSQLGTIEPLEENMPSTSSSCANTSNARQTRLRVKVRYGYMDTSSDTDTEENDSDYNPSGHKSRRHKSNRKKSSKTTSTRKSHRRKKSTCKTRSLGKVPRERSLSSSGASEDESPEREVVSLSRGRKRYLSRSSETSDPNAKLTKKKKRSKKTSKSKSKKSKKSARYDYSSTCSNHSSTDSDSENDGKNSNKRSSSRRLSREPKTTNPSHSVDSDGSECRSSRNSSLASLGSRKNGTDESRSSRRSSIASFDSRKNPPGEDRRCGSRNDTAGSCSSFSDDEYQKSKSGKSSGSSTKSDISTKSNEHSVGSKSSGKERHRSRSKRKESKKSRRSHS